MYTLRISNENEGTVGDIMGRATSYECVTAADVITTMREKLFAHSRPWMEMELLFSGVTLYAASFFESNFPALENCLAKHARLLAGETTVSELPSHLLLGYVRDTGRLPNL